MTSAEDTTRGALRRDGEAMPDAEQGAGLDGRIDRMLALGVGAGPVADNVSLDADLTTMLGLVENDGGTVTYCDASGRVWRRQPVSRWIAFTVARLFHQMQKETARQLGDPALDDDARVGLARKLRRDLRADALGIAFLRPGQAFDLADAHEVDAYSGPIPVAAVPGHGTVSPDLLWATEEHREARQLMLADPVQGRARTDAHVGRISRLAQALRDLPVRSLADLQHKALYLSPERLKGRTVDADLEATLVSLRRDVMRLAVAPPAAPSDVDQIIARWREWATLSPIRDTFDDRVKSDRASDQLNSVIDAADALPPTLENLPAKALALAWISLVSTWEQGATRDSYAMDGRLGLDIDTAIAGRVRTTGG